MPSVALKSLGVFEKCIAYIYKTWPWPNRICSLICCNIRGRRGKEYCCTTGKDTGTAPPAQPKVETDIWEKPGLFVRHESQVSHGFFLQCQLMPMKGPEDPRVIISTARRSCRHVSKHAYLRILSLDRSLWHRRLGKRRSSEQDGHNSNHFSQVFGGDFRELLIFETHEHTLIFSPRRRRLVFFSFSQSTPVQTSTACVT